MKKLLLFLFLFSFAKNFAQQQNIDKDRIVPQSIDFKNCVKKIFIEDYIINRYSNKTDSVKKISEVNFSSKGKLKSVKIYDNSTTNLWRLVSFDNLERITTISQTIENKLTPVIFQYFSTNTAFPDSTLINTYPKHKEKYINHFKNNLVVTQECFVNDSLQDYRNYKYNNQNQLIQDLYLNPENLTGETMISKNENQLSFYPERETLYEYKKVKDTVFKIKIRPKYNKKEVTKILKTNKYNLEINESYDNNFLKNSSFNYTYKDSISHSSYYFTSDKKTRSYYKTVTKPESISSKWYSNDYSNGQEKKSFTKIDIVYDKFKNWITKIYTDENKMIIHIIKRKIEYHCH